MDNIFIYYDIEENDDFACVAYTGDNIIRYKKSGRLTCEKCSCEVSPLYNYCPKCGNVAPFGLAAWLFSNGEAVSDKVDYDFIVEAVHGIIENICEYSFDISFLKIIGRTYIKDDKINKKMIIYHIITEAKIDDDNEEKYAVLLYNPENENGKIKFGDLSCAIKCEDMDDKHIKEMLKKSVESQFEIAK